MKKILLTVILALLLIVPCRAERVPILMYHDFSDEYTGDFVVSSARLEEHLTALENAGYHTVTFAELIDYVYFGGVLPDQPVLLTSDDGYTGVLTLAAPCAACHAMKLSCAVIGSLAGVNGHFAFDVPVPANVEIVSHTFMLHDRSGWNGVVCPDGDVLRYEQILTEDCAVMRHTCAERFPYTASVLIYPHGAYSAESERIFRSLGYVVTVTCERGVADVRRGDAESLHRMPRISVWQSMTGEELLKGIQENETLQGTAFSKSFPL
ncbi:MAG: hypothetical protein ACI4V1_08830 [Eubacteriales bacterium]